MPGATSSVLAPSSDGLNSGWQDFRVVFDTGSAHIILPASECQSEVVQPRGADPWQIRGRSICVDLALSADSLNRQTKRT